MSLQVKLSISLIRSNPLSFILISIIIFLLQFRIIFGDTNQIGVSEQKIPLVKTIVAGYSVKNRTIQLIQIGKDEVKTILYLGVFHGNEPQGKDLLEKFLEYLTLNPDIYKGIKILIMPLVNPDGFSLKKRTNARGVDINRNFPTSDWRKTYTMERYKPGKRLPEPETRTIISILKQNSPDVIISIHSPHRCINYDGPAKDLADLMARYNHYPVKPTMGYRTPGSFGTYAGKERNIPCITLELSAKSRLCLEAK